NFRNFSIDFPSGVLTVRFVETVFALYSCVVIRDITDFIIQTINTHHSRSLFCNSFQIAQSTCRNISKYNFLSCTSTHSSCNFIQQLLSCCNLSFFWQIPSRTQGFTSRNYSYFDQWSCMWQQPTHGSMTCFMISNSLFFFGFDQFVFLFKSTYYSIDCV